MSRFPGQPPSVTRYEPWRGGWRPVSAPPLSAPAVAALHAAVVLAAAIAASLAAGGLALLLRLLLAP